MALTDTTARNAKPREKLYRLADSLGLCLEVTTAGGKHWRFRYRHGDKPKMLGLGTYPAVTLAQARERRDEARRLLSQGVDPSTHKKEARAAAMAHVLTFEALAREWHRYNVPRWAPATSTKALTYLEADILPVIGARPAANVTRPELVELVRRVEQREAFNVARKIRQWLSQIFRFGLAKGVVPGNPATDLDVVAAHAPRTRHHPHVTEAELPELLQAVDVASCDVLTRLAIRLLVLTGVRPGELRMAPWAEFDLEAKTWTIPAARMKARRAHIVPLPRQAMLLLRQLHDITGAYQLAFPGRNDRARPMSENTINQALATMGYEGRQTGHGFRHLLSTSLNSRGYNRDWIERQLAHGDEDAIRDTYNHATYLDQRREMMQAWADSLDAMCAGAGVVPFKALQGRKPDVPRHR